MHTLLLVKHEKAQLVVLLSRLEELAFEVEHARLADLFAVAKVGVTGGGRW